MFYLLQDGCTHLYTQKGHRTGLLTYCKVNQKLPRICVCSRIKGFSPGLTTEDTKAAQLWKDATHAYTEVVQHRNGKTVAGITIMHPPCSKLEGSPSCLEAYCRNTASGMQQDSAGSNVCTHYHDQSRRKAQDVKSFHTVKLNLVRGCVGPVYALVYLATLTQRTVQRR